MTAVTIPLVRNGAGEVLPAVVSIRLVTLDDLGQESRAIGCLASGLLAEYDDLALDTAPLVVSLAPTAAITLLSGAVTWYRITVRTQWAHASWRVQVPTTDAPVWLADLLVGAALPAPAALSALLAPAMQAGAEAGATLAALNALVQAPTTRPLPDPSALPDGTMVQVLQGQWVIL